MIFNKLNINIGPVITVRSLHVHSYIYIHIDIAYVCDIVFIGI